MNQRIQYQKVAPGAAQALYGPDKYLHGGGLEPISFHKPAGIYPPARHPVTT